ncbi:glutamine amidotransferase [Anatilimnocola sp. NA78]|uniref:glutamine amidotransferase n=1 Tax=Anatilimnocola sp. NA78 TaxID=3415683 RepID=UPI003CE46F77
MNDGLIDSPIIALPLAEIILGARQWLGAAVVLAALALGLLVWSYLRTSSPSWLCIVCLLLKAAAVILLAICLLDPLYRGSRPSPGSNLFLVVADNSRSLQLANHGERESRGTQLQQSLSPDSGWLTRLAQDFDVRKYTFDTQLQPAQDFTQLDFTGEASALSTTLAQLANRYRGKPVAGILLLTDGNATDLEGIALSAKELPPIYPVSLASASPSLDLSLSSIAVSQTNFEAAPVTIAAEIATQSLAGRKITARVLDEQGQEVERQTLSVKKDSEALSHRFLIKPEKPGVSFYRVQVSLAGEEELAADSARSAEATLANNNRLATVDRGGGPYRVLYVSGLPNWEFKFLRRAEAKDDEVNLVSLVRVAKKEAKFSFRGRNDESTNPLFRGFGTKNDEQAEQYDEAVLLRLGTQDKDELRGGFPKDSEDLFKFHAIILDDMEAAFFTQDQLSLLQQFVSQRGGGLLMMGGKGSFGEGGYARTPVAEMLPVYLDRGAPEVNPQPLQLKLTREGWLQPWIRVRANEQDEQERLTSMPGFRSLNRIEAIKPGASVLAEVETGPGTSRPALAVQPFGRGRVGALLIGDLWRWELRRAEQAPSDLEKAWRQTIRWLVADVPQPVEVETKRSAGTGLPAREIIVRARDAQFRPLDNAQVSISIKTPDARELTIAAESSEQSAGEYRASFVPRLAGAYRASVVVTAPDGSDVGRRDTGWSVEPETDEFRELAGNQPLLKRLAEESGGEVISLNNLSSFVSSLPNRKIPHVETWTYPLWHQWQVLAIAVGCLVGEWGLRRWKGLA